MTAPALDPAHTAALVELVLLRARLADDDLLLSEVRELRAEFARLAPDTYGQPAPAELASLISQARRVADAFPGGGV
jgi:hypothetical protein